MTRPAVAGRTPGRVIIDCRDPERLAAFGAHLGVVVGGHLGDPPQYVDLEPLPEVLSRVLTDAGGQ